MRIVNLLCVIASLLAVSATPATSTTKSSTDVEYEFENRVALARRAYDAEVAKADVVRLGSLQELLRTAMQSGDIDEAVNLKNKIDAVRSDGLQDRGKSIIFLVQSSGSMLTAFAAAKLELKKSVSMLDEADGQKFDIIFFADGKCSCLFGGGTRACTREYKREALDFVDNAVASGSSEPMDPAVATAFAEKPEIITIFSNGFPTVKHPEEFAAAIKAINGRATVTINCDYFETDDEPKIESIQRQIAQNGNGSFLKIKNLRQ